jgi:hypothetical protein
MKFTRRTYLAWYFSISTFIIGFITLVMYYILVKELSNTKVFMLITMTTIFPPVIYYYTRLDMKQHYVNIDENSIDIFNGKTKTLIHINDIADIKSRQLLEFVIILKNGSKIVLTKDYHKDGQSLYKYLLNEISTYGLTKIDSQLRNKGSNEK